MRNRIPLWLKLIYTAFMAVLVPVYWHEYGPANFLYFCDAALFLSLAAVWLESSLLASIAAVGIVLPQMLWVADFSAHLIGFKITGSRTTCSIPSYRSFCAASRCFTDGCHSCSCSS